MNQVTKNVQFVCEILKNDEVIDFLQVVHKSIFPIYSCYCHESSLINFQSFFTIFKDYEIFPEIISKMKLENIFESLLFIYSQDPENKKNDKKTNDCINEHLFVEAFILIIQDCKFNLKKEPTIFQKITYILEIMNESKGFSKTISYAPTFQKYDLVGRLRKNYPEYFFI